jgi:hypothetical protein
LDHGILSIVLSLSENFRPPPQDRYLQVKFAKDKIPLFQERIHSALTSEASLLPPLEKGKHLLKALSSIGEDMFIQKGHHSHRNHKVLTLWNDIKVLNKIIAHLQRGEPSPHKLTRRKAYRLAENKSPQGLTKLVQGWRDQINSKARKRAVATKFMFRSKRSSYFSENCRGKFLQLALNRYNTFQGNTSTMWNTTPSRQTRNKPFTWSTPESAAPSILPRTTITPPFFPRRASPQICPIFP